MMDASDGDSDSVDNEDWFISEVRRVKNDDPNTIELDWEGACADVRTIPDDEWEEIGRDISNNTHLKELYLYNDALNDDKMSFLFCGLTRSSSIEILSLFSNEFTQVGLRSMLPFLQHASNLRELCLERNEIGSVGFNSLLRALCDSQIEILDCVECKIASIEIDPNCFPRYLKTLHLSNNNINTDGCREIAKLLQGDDSTLKHLALENSEIDDEGVAILIDALRSNKSLERLNLGGNDGMSSQGLLMLLRLVNCVSSITATLHSNHTLKDITLTSIVYPNSWSEEDEEFQQLINTATTINLMVSPGREKVIRTQLYSAKRAKLAGLQGVNQSVYSEIDPIHLPEVLSLVSRRLGRNELYFALKLSIAELISTANRKECIRQQMACLTAQLEELGAELAEIEAAERSAMDIESNEVRRNKRHRWWLIG